MWLPIHCTVWRFSEVWSRQQCLCPQGHQENNQGMGTKFLSLLSCIWLRLTEKFSNFKCRKTLWCGQSTPFLWFTLHLCSLNFQQGLWLWIVMQGTHFLKQHSTPLTIKAIFIVKRTCLVVSGEGCGLLTGGELLSTSQIALKISETEIYSWCSMYLSHSSWKV